MADSSWYGTARDSYTALLFGEISNDRKPGYVIPHFGQDAYELYMIAAYTKELTSVRNDPNYICWTPGFDAHSKLSLDLLRRHGTLTHEEMGSTLYSTIDKIVVSGVSLKQWRRQFLLD